MMQSSALAAILYALVGLLLVVLPVGLLEYAELQRRKKVVCPESGDEAHVGVDARQGAIGVALGVPRLRILSCSRWPERKSCDQSCRKQVRGPGHVFVTGTFS
jgi:hypothetical protein